MTGPCASTRWRARFLFGLLTAVLALACAAGSAAADPPTLNLVFRADFSFFAYLANGSPVGTTSGAPTVIPAGTYKVILDDSSGAEMELDLAGPGVKLVTNMAHTETSSTAYYESFQPSSTYTFRDDNRPSVVWTFQTSAETLASTPTTTTDCPTCKKPGTTGSGDIVGSAIGKTLTGTVAAGGKLGLSFSGARVGRLKAGRYTIVVDDRSPSRGFILERLGAKPQTLTGAALVGKRTRTLVLAVGKWRFFSRAGSGGSFVVVS